MKNKMFQPGVILHEVIVGVFRANGDSFDDWCAREGYHRSTARQATYGQSGGDNGRALLAKIIEAAGPDIVEAAYRKRMISEAARLEGTAA